MTFTEPFLSDMTDDERLLWGQAVVYTDLHAPLVYSDWLREQGREFEADYWQMVGKWREQATQAEYHCNRFLYSCGELYSSWNQLSWNGCDRCKRWADINLHEIAMRVASA